MNQEQIRILIEALAASELSELEYSEDGCSLRLVKQGAPSASAGRPRSLRDRGGEAVERAQQAEPASEDAPSETQAQAPDACLAPLYGVVHLQPSPAEPLFAQPGQRIAAGQTLCVIEAMKVFNEVRAEADGTLVEVLVRSGDEVEAGQPLFRLA